MTQYLNGNRMSYRSKIVLNYKGVKVFHAWKGAQALSFWYALKPNVDAEVDDKFTFDVRELPSRFTSGLILEETKRSSSYEDMKQNYNNQIEVHKEAIKRAIDENYNFEKPLSAGVIKKIMTTLFNR